MAGAAGMNLPVLNGWVGSVVLAIYRVLALVTVVYVLVTLPLEGVDLFRNGPATARYGFFAQRAARGALPVTKLYPVADRAGLRVGDKVVGVGRQTLSAKATRFDLGAKLDALGSAPATLDVRDAVGTERKVVIPPQLHALLLIHLYYGMPLWLFGIIHLFALGAPMLLLLGASFLLYTRRPHDPVAMLLAFSFLALTFSTSSGSWPFIYLGISGLVAAYAISLGTGMLCIAIAAVPEGRLSPVMGTLTLFFATIYGVGSPWTSSLHFERPIVEIAWTSTEYLTFFFATASLLLRYHRSEAVVRQQIKWVMIGVLVAALVFPVTLAATYGKFDAAVPLWGQYLLGMLPFDVFHVAIPMGMLISVLAYRLYDSEAAVTRSAAYVAASIAAVALFAASESVVQTFGQQLVSARLGAFPGTLAAVFTAMMIGPIHARIKRTAERGFRKNLFHMREGLPPLVGDLRETTELKEIAAVVLERVEDGVRPISAAIVWDEETLVTKGVTEADLAAWRTSKTTRPVVALDCDKTDPIFPVRVRLTADGISAEGWMLLGPRPDGSLFGKDERKALTEIADPVARALAIAASREARSAMHEENNRTLRTRLSEVEATLARLVVQKVGSAV